MKIEGPKEPGTIKKSGGAGDKKASTTQGAGFSSMVSNGTAGTGATTNPQSIAQLDALLAIQGAEDPTQGKSKKNMVVRSNRVLDLLDTLRVKMLSGDLTVGDMIDVADVVASHREQVQDPSLTELMDEIDLRAQVELAKMRFALDKGTDRQ